MQRIRTTIIEHYLKIGAFAAVAVLGGIYWYVSASNAPSFGTVAASRGTVVQSVVESGNVLAEQSVELSFQEPGQIAHVYAKEGDTVAAGAPIADLDQSQLAAALSQANAAAAVASARLDAMTSGTRPEELAIDQGGVQNAAAALNAAILNAYTASDDAVRNQTDNLFMNPQANNPVFVVPTSDTQAATNIAATRVSIGVALNAWYKATLNAGAGTDPVTLAAITDSSVRNVQSYLNALALAVNAVTSNMGVPATTLSGYRANVVTARTEVTAAVSALTSAEAAFTNAKNALALAQAGATPQDVEAAKAGLLQAQAGVTSAQVALDHASLRAPFSGVVQGLTAKVGQVVAPGVPVVSVVNNGGLKIEEFVSEADVVKVKAGESANVTLDAYGTGTVFPATVTTIDASKTTVNGASAYKVTLHFTNPDARIKDGMTANVAIIAAQRENVVQVPTKLIFNENNASFVLVDNGHGGERRAVVTGISGDNGMTEIVSGVNEGEKLLNF